MHSGRVSFFLLAVSLFWLVATAGLASDHPTPIDSEPQSITDAPAAGDIVGYAPSTSLRDPSDQYVPVRLADPDRVKPASERHFAETPEAQAARLALPCQNIVYRNTCPSACYVFIFGGPPPAHAPAA